MHQGTNLRTIKRAVNFATIGAVVLALAACAGGSDAPSNEDTDSVRVLAPTLPAVLDFTQSSGVGSGSLLIALEPLMRYAPDGSLEPGLATEMQTPDLNTYVYKIRQDVTFWDDSPLTAEDVAFSLNLHAGEDSKSNNASLLSNVTSIEATADDEVTMKLSGPDPQLPFALAQLGIVSKAFYEENGEDVGTPAVLNMGTGPYEFTNFTPSKSVELEANTGYWGEEPTIDTVGVDVVSDDAARLNALQSGEYDGMFNVPLPQIKSIQGLDGLSTASAPDLSVYKFNYNVETPPFDDIHVRRAMDLALNPDDIVEAALGGRAVVASTIVPEEVIAALAGDDATAEAYATLSDNIAFDRDRAKQELAQSPVPDGFSVELVVTGSDPTLALVAQTAAQDLKQIGIELNIKEVDDQTYYNAVYFKHTTDGLSLDLFSGSTTDASNLPQYILSGKNALTEGGSGVNISDYVNADVDDLLTESQKLEVDDPERGALLLEAMIRAQEDVPYSTIAFPEIYIVAREGLEIDGFDAFWWLTQWPDALAGS